MSQRADVIIVGAGIAGASLAYELSATHKVILLEREERPGMHSTGRSAAIFTEIYGNAIVRGLTRATRQFLFSPPAGFAESSLVQPRGTLYVAPEDQVDFLHNFRKDEDVAAATQEIAPQDALKMVPILRPDMVKQAMLEPGACDIDVNALHQGFLRGFKANGGALLCSQDLTSVDRTAMGWRVVTPQETFATPILVNASGAWADSVALQAGLVSLGITPKRRTVVIIDAPQGCDIRKWPLTMDAKESFYFKPDAGRLLVTPADETPTPPCDAQPEEMDMALAIERLEGMTSIQVRRIAHKWAGLRSFAPDRTPVVGFDPTAQGFFWLAGQGGYGMQTSSAMARSAAALIRGEDLPTDIRAQKISAAALSPERLRRTT